MPTRNKNSSSFGCQMLFTMGDSNVGWIHNEGINGVRSTLIMWHKETFYCDIHVVGRGFIAIFGQNLKSKMKCDGGQCVCSPQSE